MRQLARKGDPPPSKVEMIGAFQDIEDRRNRILHFGRDRIILREIGVAGLHRRCALDARVALKCDRADRDRRQPEDAMRAFDIASTIIT